MKPAGILLAGGAARRFGSDKLAAAIAGETLLERSLRALAEVADPLVLVLAPGAAQPGVPDALAGRVLVARDAVAHRGPLAGLAAGLARLAEVRGPVGPARHDGRPAAEAPVLVAGGDMPWLHPGVLGCLVEALGSDPAAGLAILDADPLPILPMALRPGIARPAVESLLAADRRRLRGLLEEVRWIAVPADTWRALDPEAATLRDVDTPGDLR